MSQIALVTHQHDDDIGIGVISQLLQPPRHILIGGVLANVVNEQCTDGSAIVGRRDRPIALLTCRVPDLLEVSVLTATRLLHSPAEGLATECHDLPPRHRRDEPGP